MEDAEIVALLEERSEQAIGALQGKYGALCLRIAGNILNNTEDAEECVNDALLAVWKTVPPQHPEPLVSYVVRIVRNLSLKRYHSNTAVKRNSRYDVALEELEDCLASVQTVESTAESNAVSQAVNRFLMTLKKDQRILFVRRYWYGDSIGQLAALMGISEHTVSVRLSRIRAKLNIFLEKEGFSQ